MSLPVVLTIAGSDSGGGAGIQADLKTFQALGCFGTTAITAITCQNTTGVSAVQAIDPDIVAGQIRDVLTDLPVQAAKTGMLFSRDIMDAVRNTWKKYAEKQALIVDPVMVASSGDRLLEPDAEDALIEFLNEATLITPNLPEAEVILNKNIDNLDAMKKAAKELNEQTGAAVLLKGGHRLSESQKAEKVTDVLFYEDKLELMEFPLYPEKNTHGTGCTLSAAIAAGMAKGLTLLDAVREARKFIDGAIKNAAGIGAGTGPLNHLWNQKFQ
ncbi:MAG: bifunctional hydroxymethylpyrimidine kinase/phosphomethylpyrimidine kinase [Spirochaetaceae bacterium]|nr:bifunctional hydroxymethylpyrimidine kinase/phosphomethylpyrimidine kinase [Spirochaetaceae bacterium]|tara:strand:+ start:290335 stop:291147 length:813 start_codon:yes stop_codon:yes gene_type:complete